MPTTKHGLRKSKEYSSWDHMKSRCYNPKNASYIYYGTKGIKVCERWLNSFENFYSDMGECPSNKHSLDRIRVNEDYGRPGNCKWSTNIEQQRNRSDNRLIEHNGSKLTFSEWAANLNMDKSTLFYRLSKGWSENKALSTPVRKKRR